MKKLLTILAVLSVVTFAAVEETKDSSDISNGFLVMNSGAVDAIETTGEPEVQGSEFADLGSDTDVTDLFPTELA